MPLWLGAGIEGADAQRQPELARARQQQVGIADRGERRFERLLRQAYREIRADAGRFTGRQQQARHVASRCGVQDAAGVLPALLSLPRRYST